MTRNILTWKEIFDIRSTYLEAQETTKASLLGLGMAQPAGSKELEFVNERLLQLAAVIQTYENEMMPYGMILNSPALGGTEVADEHYQSAYNIYQATNAAMQKIVKIGDIIHG